MEVNMRKLKVWNALGLLTYSILSVAAESTPTFGSFASPLGASASNNLIKFDQSLSSPFHNSANKAEYTSHIEGSHNLWGVKFLSNYLGLSAKDRMNSGQALQLSQTSIDHELGVLAYIGRSFANGHVYLGGGPSLFGGKSNVYDTVGTSGQNSITADFNPANSRLVWGGAAQLGMSYYFDPSWYLDLNYTYAITGLNNTGPYTSLASYASNGPYMVNANQPLTAQALALSVKKFFSF
jgi:hypothetical protein